MNLLREAHIGYKILVREYGYILPFLYDCSYLGGVLLYWWRGVIIWMLEEEVL